MRRGRSDTGWQGSVDATARGSVGSGVRVACAALFVMTIALHWFRAPWVPAVSGDEVYFAEDAYYLLREGRLRQPFLDNPQGMAERAYFPPVAVFAQAAMMAVFGATPLGITAGSSLCASILMILFVLAARRAGLRGGWCWLAGVAPLGFALAERRFAMVRMETWTAVLAVAAILFLDAGAAAGRRRRLVYFAAAGASAVVAGLAYYPHAPFVGLAIFVALLVYVWGSADWLRVCAAFALGAAVPAGVFVAWVARAPELFAAQYLGGQASLYLGWRQVPDAIAGALRLNSLGDLLLWELAVCCVIGCAAAAYRGGMARASGIAALIMASTFLLYALANRSAPVPVLAVLSLLPVAAHGSGRFAQIARLVVVLLALGGFGRTALVAATAVLQREGRDYGPVREALLSVIQKDGKIATTQVGWLALRPVCNDHRLLFFMTCFDASLFTRPTILRDDKGWRSIRYFVLNLGSGGAEAVYPWFKDGLARGAIVPIKTIAPSFRSLPWAGTPVYLPWVYENLEYVGEGK